MSTTVLPIVVILATRMAMAKTPSTGIRLDPDLRAFLERKAKEDGRSLSSMIHKILETWAKNNAKK